MIYYLYDMAFGLLCSMELDAAFVVFDLMYPVIFWSILLGAIF